MIVKGNGKKEEPPKPFSETKKAILAELEKADDAVLTLAYMFARNFELCGEDVTKVWTNAIQNNALVEKIYQKGYEEALKDVAAKKRKDFYHHVTVDAKE